MITKALILRLFDAASMQRWNDKLRPVELTELDKQAHKMVIAYLLGKLEERRNRNLNWIAIIEGGLFELLQRLIVTDLKPQVFAKIKKDRAKYQQLSEWAYKKLVAEISPLGNDFCERFKNHFASKGNDINRRVLNAAHFYATKWEFNIIERANPTDYEVERIRKELNNDLEKYCKLSGMKDLISYPKFNKFIDLCGLLRFQIRWGHLYRVPRTSVLGHMLIVAILSYLFSLEAKACEKRCVNNYFTGLFHDFPEVLTRDISSPVKNAIEGLDDIIKEYEKEEMDREVYKLIPKAWHPEMKMFTEREFESVITLKGRVAQRSSGDISKNFNQNQYNPRDGVFVKASDDLAAFVEAYLAKANGINNPEFDDATSYFRKKYKAKDIAGINLGQIYAEFER
ncbi:MAG: HD domain-containing protein [Dehalococcoidia bacterium]|nr:HD domain-containing protein [Dehalococcoidia bacterium]